MEANFVILGEIISFQDNYFFQDILTLFGYFNLRSLGSKPARFDMMAKPQHHSKVSERTLGIKPARFDIMLAKHRSGQPGTHSAHTQTKHL